MILQSNELQFHDENELLREAKALRKIVLKNFSTGLKLSRQTLRSMPFFDKED